MKLWKWLDGRQQECRYKKLCLYSFRVWKWGFDCYVLKYQPNTLLPIHNDPVVNGKHWRMNVPLWGGSTFYWCGGYSIFGENSKWLYTKSIIIFRPDLQKHFLNVYEKGCTKLSFGFVKFD